MNHEPDTAETAETRETAEMADNRKERAFDALFSEWLTLRGIIDRNDTTDAKYNERLLRTLELEKTICFTPVVRGWQIIRKIEVLEYCLRWEAEAGQFDDNRSIPMLAAVKADLLRFQLVED